MKKLLFLATCALSLTATAQQRYDLNLSDAKVEWNADYASIDVANNSFVYDNGTDYGNAAVSWLNYTVTDLSSYNYLVLELAEAAEKNIEIIMSQDGFWGTKYQSQSYLNEGETKIVLDLNTLVCNLGYSQNEDRDNDGELDKNENDELIWYPCDATNESLDLTKINLIFLRTGWTNSQTIKIKEFYLTDKMGASTDTSFFLLSELDDIYHDNTSIAVTQNEDNTATLEYKAVPWYRKAGWGGLSYDLSSYARLIVDFATFEVKDEVGNPVEVEENAKMFNLGLEVGGAEGVIADDNVVFTDNMQRTLDLATLNSMQSSAITGLWLGTHCNEYYRYVTIKGVTLATDYIRETTAGNYGTICLPAPAEAINATVYSIAGKDENGIYLEEITGNLEAGVPYFFHADADNVSFNYTGKATAEESNCANGLCGTFAKTTIAQGAYVLGAGNKLYPTNSEAYECGTNRAYIILTDVPEISGNTENLVNLRFDLGEVTGIESVEGEAAPQTVDVYTLQGIRVRHAVKTDAALNGLSKGIYIVNGKKVAVK